MYRLLLVPGSYLLPGSYVVLVKQSLRWIGSLTTESDHKTITVLHNEKNIRFDKLTLRTIRQSKFSSRPREGVYWNHVYELNHMFFVKSRNVVPVGCFVDLSRSVIVVDDRVRILLVLLLSHANSRQFVIFLHQWLLCRSCLLLVLFSA